METTKNTDGGCEPHDGGKATAADMRRAHTLHDPECDGRDSSDSTGDSIIRGAGVAKNTAQMSSTGEYVFDSKTGEGEIEIVRVGVDELRGISEVRTERKGSILTG